MKGSTPARSRQERAAAHIRAPLRRWLCHLACLLPFLATTVRAADHGIALAFPVAGSRIRIDGDLSEWPTHLPRYVVGAHFLAAQPVDAEDLSGEFRLGYDEMENCLYVALEVRDADRGEATTPVALWRADSAVAWVRIPGREQREETVLGFIGNPDYDVSGAIIPSAPWYSTVTAPKHFSVGRSRHGDRWHCEYRIDIGSLTQGREHLGAGQTIGFNISLWSMDRLPGGQEDEGAAWVASALPHQRDGWGDVLLVQPQTRVGRLVGQVRLWDGQSPETAKKVRLQAESAPPMVVHAVTDREGGFATELPVGRYRVTVAQRGWELRTNAVAVVSTGQVARVELIAPPVTGRVVAAGQGQTRPAGRGTRQGAWLTYGVADGLPRPMVVAILQDRQGVLWFGTGGGGLVRFDGSSFTTYTQADGLASDDMSELVEDGRGDLWATYWVNRLKGVTRFARRESQFITYNSEDALALDVIEAMTLDRDGRVWLATQGVPTCWDPVRGQFARPHAAGGSPGRVTTALHGGPSGRVWGGPLISTVIDSWDNGQLTTHPGPIPVFVFHHLLEDRRGGLWVTGVATATSGKGAFLYRYDATSHSWDSLDENRGYGGQGVTALYEDRQGRVWLGTGQGLLRFDGQHFEDVGKVTGWGAEAVCAICEDREGRLWIGVQDGGLRCLDPNWTTFTTGNGLASNGVLQLLKSDGHLLVGTKEGLSRLRPGLPLSFDRLSSTTVKSLRVDRQRRLWISSGWGLSVLTSEGTEALAGLTRAIAAQGGVENPQDTLEDAEGDLWIAFSLQGLGRVSHKDITEQYESHWPKGDPAPPVSAMTNAVVQFWSTLVGLPDNRLIRLTRSADGQLWIATSGGGVIRYDGRQFFSYRVTNGLASDWVNDIASDPKSRLWFATAGGLSRFDGQRWKSYTRANGLPTDELRTLMVDRQGRIWIGTTGGGVAIYDPALEVFQTLSWRQGLSHNTVNALLEDEPGDIWIGTEGGLSRYRVRTNVPAIRITGVSVGGQALKGERIELAGRPRRLSVAFEGVSLGTHPDDMVYLARLAGHQDREQAVYSRQVEYAALPCGEFEFQVRAVDRDLNVSAPVSLRLVVRRDYAQLGLVGGLGLAVAGGLAAGGLALKHRRERNQALLERSRSLEVARQAAVEARVTAESANRAKSLFLANMSHEIRTPMNAILGYAQILRGDGAMPPEQQRQALETIERSGTHLLEMINDILDLAKIESGRLELKEVEFDLGGLVDGLESLFRRRCELKGLAFKVECGPWNAPLRRLETPGPPAAPETPPQAILRGLRVRGDEGKLRQTLTNLLGNAVKFTTTGEVKLRVLMAPSDPSGVSRDRSTIVDGAAPDGGGRPVRFRFEIVDTGPGIVPGLQARLFQPFQQGDAAPDQGGTGLGLAITRRLTEAMGGRVGVESAPGRGSRFWIEVPLRLAAPEPAATPPTATGSSPERTAPRRQRLAPGVSVQALVVDDVRENRDVLSLMLRQLGCEVDEASSGPAALEHLRRARSDIVFLDIRMPGMDGMETLRRMKTELTESGRTGSPAGPLLPPRFVAVSASALGHERDRCLTSGFDAFLGKPFLVAELTDVMDRLLHLRWVVATAEAVEGEALHLPRAVVERLLTSARGYRVTELKQGLGEIESLGAAGVALAGRLRRLALASRMTEVVQLLEAQQGATTPDRKASASAGDTTGESPDPATAEP